MGHDFGLHWLIQSVDSAGTRTWTKEEIDRTFSQVHALHLADFDGDGEQEFVTGKRIYAHAVEPGATDAPCIYIFRFDRSKKSWSKITVHLGQPAPAAPLKPEDRNALKDLRPGSAGTGLRMALHDMDGDGDIDIGRDQDSDLAVSESMKNSLTGILGSTPVDPLCGNACSDQRLVEAIRAMLGSHEDQDACASRVGQ
jgi:hypothetical protein